MKRQSEKLAEPAMRFFTPERYVRINSADDDDAALASEEWETAIEEYRRHLKRLRPRLKDGARELAELCLHDAMLLEPKQVVSERCWFVHGRAGSRTPRAEGVAVVLLEKGDRVVTLCYSLSARVRRRAVGRRWAFVKNRPLWLYDEVDLDPSPAGRFVHRVFVSDGRVLEIPFAAVNIVDARLNLPADAKLARAGA